VAKKRQNNNDLNRSLAMSVALHVAVIILFILGSTMTVLKVSGGGGGAIEAVMLDPGTLTQTANQQTDKQKELEAQRKAEELKAKQEAEKKRLEEERVKKEVEQAKQEEEIRKAAAERKAAEQARIKQEQDEKAKQQAEDAQKIAEAKKAEEARKAEQAKKEEEIRKAAEAKRVATEKADAERKAAEVKKAAEAKKAAEQKAQQQANTNDVNSLLDDLVGSPPPSSQRGSGTSTGVGSGAREGQINEYVSQIKSAIERHLNDYHLYKGKTCDLKITLAKDGGRLINATIVKGDSALCQLALSAALEVNIPKPPSAAVYEAVKNAILVFEPK